MAIDFPNSPTLNQVYTVGDRSWIWNGTYWAVSGTSSTFSAADTPPSNPTVGDLWFESDTGKTFVYYDNYWVEIGTASGSIDAGNLAGTTLSSSVVSSSLTSLGTITNLQATAATINGWTISQPGLVFISQTSILGSSGTAIPNCFSSTYDNYKIVISNYTASTASSLLMKLRSGSTNSDTGYYYGGLYRLFAGTGGGDVTGSNQVSWLVATGSTTPKCGAVLEMLNPNDAIHTTFTLTASNYDAYFVSSGVHQVNTAYDSLYIYPGAGTFTATVRIYGYRD